MFLFLASAPKFEAEGSKKSAAKGQYIWNQWKYEGWNFNIGNYLFTTDTK